MLCHVYRSHYKDNCYLFLLKKDNFLILPEALQVQFKKSKYVMPLLLGQKKLLGIDHALLGNRLQQTGYYLYIAPSIEEILSNKDKE